LVGLLIRARKRSLLHFEGEMLYQNRDDDQWVVLTKSINTIHAYFGRDSKMVGGGVVDTEVQDSLVFRNNSDSRDSRSSSVDSTRRNSKVSICSLPPTCLGPPRAAGCLSVAAVTTGPDIQFDPSAAESRDKFPEHEAESGGGHSSRISAKGLRNSFRKLVKPLVKKRVPDCEDSSDDSRPHSKDGSPRPGLGLQSAGSCGALAIKPPAGPESRWKKVLGVSMAIGRSRYIFFQGNTIISSRRC
jgi:hypothetical protein